MGFYFSGRNGMTAQRHEGMKAQRRNGAMVQWCKGKKPCNSIKTP
jgi:hypothetical protein